MFIIVLYTDMCRITHQLSTYIITVYLKKKIKESINHDIVLRLRLAILHKRLEQENLLNPY